MRFAAEPKTHQTYRSLIEGMMSVQSIFHNTWTEDRKQEGLRKPIFFGGGRVVAFHQVAPLCIKQFMNGKNKICSELYGIKVCQKLCKLVQLF